MTPLDKAAKEAAKRDTDAARLRFFERLVDAELFLALEAEPTEKSVEPLIFNTTEGKFVLAFDTDERMAEFTETATPFVALSGRSILSMIEDSGLGLAVNPDAVSETLLAPETVDWLLGTLSGNVQQSQAQIKEISAPVGLPEELVEALDAKLAAMLGMARTAYLAKASYVDGGQGHVLVFVGAPNGAEEPVATAITETLAFSGLDAAMLDLAFIDSDDPMVETLSKVGLRFDLPEPTQADAYQPAAPGSDPNKPPILR